MAGQTHLVYYAEEVVAGELGDDRRVEEHELEAFAARVLTKAGWECDSPVVFALDLTDESEWSGRIDYRNGEPVVRLHPKLLFERTIVHELAHWVDPRDGHGPRFCANYLELLLAAQGLEVASELLATFLDLGVEVDQEWIPADLLGGGVITL